MIVGGIAKIALASLCMSFLVLTGCSTAPPEQTVTSGVTSIPLDVSKAKGSKRAVIQAEISGTSLTFLFDTGSVGLSIFATSAPEELASATGTSFQDSFADGVQVSGVIVPASVTVAGKTTGAPIDIGIIQSVSCVEETPDCDAATGMESFAKTIGADGIFGAGFWSNGSLFSPLLQLDGPTPAAVSVHWDGREGAVQLYSSPQQMPGNVAQMPSASPASLPNGAPAWDNQNVQICWQIQDAQSTCMPTVFDTGASAMSFPEGFPGTPDREVKELVSGTTITGTIDSGGQAFVSLITGKELGKNLVTVFPNTQMVNTGIGLFAEYEVLFSVQSGEISLTAHS